MTRQGRQAPYLSDISEMLQLNTALLMLQIAQQQRIDAALRRRWFERTVRELAKAVFFVAIGRLWMYLQIHGLP